MAQAAFIQKPLGATDNAFRLSFVDGDLVNDILTVTHNLGVRYHNVTVYDSSGERVDLSASPVFDLGVNSLNIDLSAVGIVAGTWNVVVGA